MSKNQFFKYLYLLIKFIIKSILTLVVTIAYIGLCLTFIMIYYPFKILYEDIKLAKNKSINIYKKIFNNFLLIFDAIKKSNLAQINKIKNEDFIVFLKIKNKIALIASIIYLIILYVINIIIILVINMFVFKIPEEVL